MAKKAKSQQPVVADQPDPVSVDQPPVADSQVENISTSLVPSDPEVITPETGEDQLSDDPEVLTPAFALTQDEQAAAHLAATQMNNNQLGEYVKLHGGSICRKLVELHPYLAVLWDRFAHLKKNDTICQCHTAQEYAKKWLSRDARSVRYMLAGGNKSNGKSNGTGDLTFQQVAAIDILMAAHGGPKAGWTKKATADAVRNAAKTAPTDDLNAMVKAVDANYLASRNVVSKVVDVDDTPPPVTIDSVSKLWDAINDIPELAEAFDHIFQPSKVGGNGKFLAATVTGRLREFFEIVANTYVPVGEYVMEVRFVHRQSDTEVEAEAAVANG